MALVEYLRPQELRRLLIDRKVGTVGPALAGELLTFTYNFVLHIRYIS
jgi:hypothetical protein